MPEGTRLMGFADDVAIVVVAKHLSDAERSRDATKQGKEQAYGAIPRDSLWQRTRLIQF